ncbi:hypothetical protein SAMN04487944_10590 [Gracilibacillus ureilyticus]|uniref:Oxidoreductase family, NAD-binding Rossmann fold n=2 Tax=Gracilibacillus ureilyticus TaxID=531814 RepID=A0A1H9PNY9_9BACI|nr:hypothetical protein SAMN04487944_10590 [Gracilibacillus ureilyticus]
MRKLKLGIAGFHEQSNSYISLIKDGMIEGVEVGAVYDPDPYKRKQVKSLYPEIPFYTDYVEMLESGEVEAVVSYLPQYNNQINQY